LSFGWRRNMRLSPQPCRMLYSIWINKYVRRIIVWERKQTGERHILQ
jgi:hypothetical protein